MENTCWALPNGQPSEAAPSFLLTFYQSLPIVRTTDMLRTESCWYCEKELMLICKQEKVKFRLVEAGAANAVPPRLSVKAWGGGGGGGGGRLVKSDI